MSQLPDERTPPSLREEIFQRIRQGVSLSESGHFTEAIHDALRPALRLAEELDRRTEGEYSYLRPCLRALLAGNHAQLGDFKAAANALSATLIENSSKQGCSCGAHWARAYYGIKSEDADIGEFANNRRGAEKALGATHPLFLMLDAEFALSQENTNRALAMVDEALLGAADRADTCPKVLPELMPTRSHLFCVGVRAAVSDPVRAAGYLSSWQQSLRERRDSGKVTGAEENRFLRAKAALADARGQRRKALRLLTKAWEYVSEFDPDALDRRETEQCIGAIADQITDRASSLR